MQEQSGHDVPVKSGQVENHLDYGYVGPNEVNDRRITFDSGQPGKRGKGRKRNSREVVVVRL
jgi:hypothetical protein